MKRDTPLVEAERGSIMIMVLLFAAAVLLSLLALADSGQKLNTLSAAYDLAGETARYAAAFVDESSLQAGDPRIDAPRARAEAQAFATNNGADNVVVDVAADGLSVIVTISVSGSESITPGFDMTAQVSHQAFVIARPN